MLGVLIADFPDGPSSVLKGAALAAATPSPSPSIISSDYASALPSWLLVALLGVVTLVIVGAFALTAYSLSAPRSTLKNIIGRSKNKRPWNIWDHFGRRPSSPKGTGPAPRKQKSNKPPGGTVSAQLVKSLATSARSGRRTTRTTLAIVGFSLLGVVIIAIFGLSGQGVRDLRSQVIAAVTTLVATIAGFYFGAEAARNQGAQSGSAGSAPVFRPDPKDPGFIVGQPGTYTPILTGTPPPTVSLTQGTLPSGLKMDAHTGVISGTAEPGTAGQHTVTLTAKNGISPDVTLPLTLTVAEHPPPTTPPPTSPPPTPPPTSPPPTSPPPTTPPPTSPPTSPPTTVRRRPVRRRVRRRPVRRRPVRRRRLRRRRLRGRRRLRRRPVRRRLRRRPVRRRPVRRLCRRNCFPWLRRCPARRGSTHRSAPIGPGAQAIS